MGAAITRRIYIRGLARTLVPIGVLGGLYVGSNYYWPDSYLAEARPSCGGFTPEGCVLRWQEVELLEDGTTTGQCVRMCPKTGVAPPVSPSPQNLTTEDIAPVPSVAGECKVVIYSERDFRGLDEETSENEPRLDEVGWQDDISSIEVISGTWDFYSGLEYKGEVLRLPPGKYDDLGDKWTKRIGSFLCVQP